MYRVPPHMAGKNITYQAWVKKEQETHRRNVKSMTSHLIESGAMKPPTRVAVLEANPRKQKLEAERIQAIEAENARLLQRMTKIMDQGPQFTVLHRSKVFISNAVSRKLAATKIAQRNLEFCERINKVRPYYDTKKWDEDRKVTEHILKGMGLYPYHPPQPKRWQDYFEAEGEEDFHDAGVEEELDRQWVQSLASFSNRPSQINEEISRSDSFSPKSLRRPRGDSWMLPGLARPGQYVATLPPSLFNCNILRRYSRDSSGRISQTLSDGRMEQLSPDSPSMGSAAPAAARSGLRLQPLVKTPALEAVPRRNDVPVLNSRPSSREAAAPTAADRVSDLWSSDGPQGDRGRSHAGQQQQLQMSLRADEPDDERQADQRAIRDADSVEQEAAPVVAKQPEAASNSPSNVGLDDDAAAAAAGGVSGAADLSAGASPRDEADATAAAVESAPLEHVQAAVSATAAVGDTSDGAAAQDGASEGAPAAEARDCPAAPCDAVAGGHEGVEAEADSPAPASMPDAFERSSVAAPEDRPATEQDEGTAPVAAPDASAVADASCADENAQTGDTGHAAAASSSSSSSSAAASSSSSSAAAAASSSSSSSAAAASSSSSSSAAAASVGAGRSESPSGGLQETGQQHSADEPDVGGSDMDAAPAHADGGDIGAADRPEE